MPHDTGASKMLELVCNSDRAYPDNASIFTLRNRLKSLCIKGFKPSTAEFRFKLTGITLVL
ncbi:protein of unknown function [Pararobbsia alpina]